MKGERGVYCMLSKKAVVLGEGQGDDSKCKENAVERRMDGR